jgi:hypothetical protein
LGYKFTFDDFNTAFRCHTRSHQAWLSFFSLDGARCHRTLSVSLPALAARAGRRLGGPEGNRVTTFEPPPPIDPKHTAILTDSTSTSVVRSIVEYLAVVAPSLLVCVVLGSLVHFARLVFFILFVALACFWSLLTVIGTVSVVKQRKANRIQAPPSSNHALQPTADRLENYEGGIRK